MANLQSRIVEILDNTMREWRKVAIGAGYEAPPMTPGWLSELAEEIVAEVGKQWPTYGPESTRVPAGEIRRPDLPGMRQAGDDLGEEILPQ